jgi:alpha-beta hydrolase superfamily lysophospholipase
VCSLLSAGFKKAVELGMAAKPLRDWRRIAARRRINSHRKEIREQDLLHMDIHRTFMLLDETLRAENPTYGMIDSMFQAAFRLHDPSFLNSITTPILIGIGEKDDIVNNEAIERAAALLPESTSVRVKEGLHGLWTERSPVRAEWWGYVDGFLNDRHLKLGAVLSPARFGSVNDNISSLIPKGPHAA